MIYVTHDQTEALTFADQVVVMHDGEVVQIGTPDELFERPAHTFVGYFIGSPGMNVLPAEVRGRPGAARRPRRSRSRGPTARCRPARASRSASGRSSSRSRAGAGLPVDASSASTTSAATASSRVARRRASRSRRTVPKARCSPAARRRLVFDPAQIHVYADGWRGRGDGVMDKTVNQKAWLLVLPVFAAGGLHRRHPADDGGQLFGAGHLRQQPVLLERRRLVRGAARHSRALPRRRSLRRKLALLRDHPGDRGAARHRRRARDAAQGLGRAGLPGADGAAAAHPVERGRRDLAHLRAAPTSACSATTLNALGIDYNYTRQSARRLVHHHRHGRLALDVAWSCCSCYAGLISIPDAYYQAAKIDGASRWAVFRYIQLPKMKRVLLIAVLLRFMD